MRITRDVVVAVLLIFLAGSVPPASVTVHGVLQTAGATLLIMAVARLCWLLISMSRNGTAPQRVVTLMSMVSPRSLTHALDPGLRTRARHEAAHAVAVHVLGATLHCVSTRPMRASGGRTIWSAGDELSETDRLVITVIGAVADGAREADLAAVPDDDFTRAQRQAMGIAMQDGHSVGRLLDEAISRARTLLATNSTAVDRLAHALSTRPRTLTGAQAIAHIQGEGRGACMSTLT